VKEKLAERIRMARLTKNFSQQNMADELDITVAAYSNIERGVTELTVTRLLQISRILEINGPDLIREDPHAVVNDGQDVYQTAITQQLLLLMQQMQQHQIQLDALQTEIRNMKSGVEEPKKNSRLR
jgi:transcriptional regulator with XRE-family HTH domain